MSDSKPNIVRPFGLIGGEYEVDAAGVRKYRLAWGVAVATIGLSIFGEPLGAPSWLTTVMFVTGAVMVMALCVDIVRKGRKI